MLLYRSIPGQNSGPDYSETYTVKRNKGGQDEIYDGSCCYQYDGRDDLADTTIVVGNQVCSCACMFNECESFSGDLFIQGTTYRPLNMQDVFYVLAQNRKNIHFNPALNNQVNQLTVWGTTPQWTTMTNGFYNTYYNIYCYNNYSG